uniref:Uncharacterized protein n=1 Tax=Ditylenchus dipsaci TaxID=166011 RepID=A0A915CW70_9BILA
MENIIANYGSSSESEDEQVKTPRKLKSYSTELKLKVAKHAKDISIHGASNKFKVGRAQESSPGVKFKKRLPGGGRRLTFNDLDDQLAAWVRERRSKKLRVSRRIVQ